MIHSLKITFRFLKKHLGFTAINVIGLSIGMAVCFMILNYIIHELSFDRFNTKYDRLGRVTVKAYSGGEELSAPFTFGQFGPEAARELAFVEHFMRFYPFGSFEIEKEEKKFTNEKGIYLDSTFFDLFDYELISGVPEKALTKEHSVIITQRLAKKIFGEEDPYMKTLEMDGEKYSITGVIEDFPPDSHIDFDIGVSFVTISNPEYDITQRDGISFPTYLLLKENVDRQEVEEKINELTARLGEEMMGEYSLELDVKFQPLSDIHLRSDFTFEYARTTDIANIYLFAALAIFVILIAVINFINLSTVLYEKRSREIGIRKVTGAYRNDLVAQFISESVLVALLAFLFALLWVELLTQPFSHLMNANIPVIYRSSPVYLLGIILFVVLVGALSGLYPALYLSGIKPISAIKGSFFRGNKYTLRKVLVVFQFAISVFMIIILLLLYSQMQFVKNKDLGFERENVVVYQSFTEKLRESYESLKTELEQLPYVESAAASQLVPGKERSHNNVVYKEGQNPDEGVIMNINRIQHDYIGTYGMELIDGRDFSEEARLDTGRFIINQTAARKLSLDDPVGKVIYNMNRKGRVIGLVKDFHIKSLHSPVDPLVFQMTSNYFRYISIRLKPGDPSGALSAISGVFRDFDPAYEIDYFFTDNVFRNLYAAEDRTFKLFTYAAILAIIISVLGMFSLTALSMQKRTKEIGIRKTLGAKTGSIIWLLLHSTTIWALVANLIAWPVAYFFMQDWLQKFEFRINILDFWWCFVLAAVIAYLQAVLTVIYQSVKASHTNPVDALKYE